MLMKVTMPTKVQMVTNKKKMVKIAKRKRRKSQKLWLSQFRRRYLIRMTLLSRQRDAPNAQNPSLNMQPRPRHENKYLKSASKKMTASSILLVRLNLVWRERSWDSSKMERLTTMQNLTNWSTLILRRSIISVTILVKTAKIFDIIS